MKKETKSNLAQVFSNEVRVDKALNTFDDVILFPEKLARANATLRRVGAPDDGIV